MTAPVFGLVGGPGVGLTRLTLIGMSGEGCGMGVSSTGIAVPLPTGIPSAATGE